MSQQIEANQPLFELQEWLLLITHIITMNRKWGELKVIHLMYKSWCPCCIHGKDFFIYLFPLAYIFSLVRKKIHSGGGGQLTHMSRDGIAVPAVSNSLLFFLLLNFIMIAMVTLWKFWRSHFYVNYSIFFIFMFPIITVFLLMLLLFLLCY